MATEKRYIRTGCATICIEEEPVVEEIKKLRGLSLRLLSMCQMAEETLSTLLGTEAEHSAEVLLLRETIADTERDLSPKLS
jgi:hypothetical protein